MSVSLLLPHFQSHPTKPFVFALSKHCVPLPRQQWGVNVCFLTTFGACWPSYENNTAVVSVLSSLTLWKNSPENYFFSSILLGILQCYFTKTWQKFTCCFYWNHSLWYWKMLSCFSIVSFGCGQILSPVYKVLKWRVIFLFGIYVVDSPLIFSK